MTFEELTVSDIGELIRGVTFSKSDSSKEPKENTVAVLRSGNVQRELITDDKLLFIPSSKPKERQMLKKDDIVISVSNSRELVGKSALARKDWHGTFGAFLTTLRVDKTIANPKYVYYFMQTRRWLNEIASESTATNNIANINNSRLGALKIHIPSLSQQENIVSKIEELFSELDETWSNLNNASRLYRSYEQAVIDTLFYEFESSALMVEFGEVAEIKGGITKGRKIKGAPLGEMPYLRVANVQDGYLNLDKIKTISITDDELNKYKLESGDILFIEGGDKDKLGRGTIWRGEIEPCIHQNHIFRARVDRKELMPEYVSFAAKTTRARSYFFSKAKQTTNLASLNMTNLRLFKLPLIPIAQQKDLVDSITAKLDELRSAGEETVAVYHQSESLKQSILTKAFKGELI